jgi:phosphotransferase system enzyme I (PtsI)
VTERRLVGQVASAGVAIGSIHVAEFRSFVYKGEVNVSLAEAIVVTIGEIRDLQRGLDSDSAEILQFQIELLEDPALTAEAFAAVASGTRADDAFRDAMQAHLKVYEDSADEYLRARESDVRDLRDRVLRALAGTRRAAIDPTGAGAILIIEDLTPSGFIEIDWSRTKGAALIRGSSFSHVAMLARARGIPLIVGLEHAATVQPGAACILDADLGLLVLDPGADTLAHYQIKLEAASDRSNQDRLNACRPAVTRDGRPIRVYANIDGFDSLRDVPGGWFDGIGLTRTELLLDTSAGIPDVDTQVDCYARLFDWSAGRPTTIRLFDAGADKPIPGLTLDGETNPYLGMRGVRLLLRTPDVLKSQLAAILDAAKGSCVRILIPMVTIPEEFEACRAILEEITSRRKVDRAAVELGMMVETPAAAMTIGRFDADFFSIGTNDLIQYVMAAGRDQRELQYLQSATEPAVIELISRVARHGRDAAKEVSVCGDAAFGPDLAALLRTGISTVSVPAQRGAEVKSLIRMTGVNSS